LSRFRPPGSSLNFILGLLALIIVMFIGVPLAQLLLGSDPSLVWQSLRDERVTSSIWLTLYTAVIATGVGLVFGVPLAYILAKRSFPGKGIIEGLVSLPIVIPHTAAGIALLFVFGRSFIAGRAFEGIGIDFIDSEAGIVIAMLFVSVPFLIESAKEGFKSVDPRMESVARTLGASPWRVMRMVTLPLAGRSILTGCLLMWARGISEFGAVVILTYHPMTAPVLVYERLQTRGLEETLPIAALLLVISLVIFIAFRWLLSRGRKT
jgi:molybdate/tungstate transport system permease protein